jgi:bacillithiol biosynthesis deacetylase BshB1
MKLSVRENLAMEDGNIENTKKNRLKIIKSIREYKPDIVLIPYWSDRHPDHVAASKLVSDSIYYAGLKKIETNQQKHRPQMALHYMLHQTFIPSFIVDISEEMEEKIQSIKCYKSQFQKSDNKTFINQPEFFDSIINRAKFYGYEIKKEFGEPYFFNGVLRVNNIFEFLS